MTGKQIACQRCAISSRKCDKALPTCGQCALDGYQCEPRYSQKRRRPLTAELPSDNTEGEPERKRRHVPRGDPAGHLDTDVLAARITQIANELTMLVAPMRKPQVNEIRTVADGTTSANTPPLTSTPAGHSNTPLVSTSCSAKQPLALVQARDRQKRLFFPFEYCVNDLCAYLQAHSPEHIQLTWVGSPAVEQARSGRFLSVIIGIGVILEVTSEWCSERGISRSGAKIPFSDLLNTIKSSKQGSFAFQGEEEGSSDTAYVYIWARNNGDGVTLPQVFGDIVIKWVRPADVRVFIQWWRQQGVNASTMSLVKERA